MGQSRSKGLLLDAYLKLNMISFVLAIISASLAGILTGLAVFLVSLHATAAAVYLLDLKSLRLKEIIDNLVVTQILIGKKLREENHGVVRV